MENQISKIDNEVVESNDRVVGQFRITGKVIQGANPEYVRIEEKRLIYIPLFV